MTTEEREPVEPTQEQPGPTDDAPAVRDADGSGGAYGGAGVVPEGAEEPETSPGIRQETAPLGAGEPEEQAQR